jgi:transposase
MIVQAEIPDAVRYPVLKHSAAGPTMIAQALFEKFVQGIPFYRQEKEWERLGIALSRETMSNWAITTSRDYFGPLQGISGRFC